MPVDFHAAFAAALRDPGRAAPPGLCCPDGSDPARRFRVYRNNHYAALIGALADGYPSVQRLVGEEFFRALAAAYARQHAPRSPVMHEYGGEFPDFIAGFPPAAALPYLADVARVDWAWLRAYHAADRQALPATELAPLADSPAVAELRLELHPSLTVVDSDWPVVSIWEANRDAGDPRPLRFEHRSPEAAMVLRPGRLVRVHRLAGGGARFVRELQAGRSLGDAATAAIEVVPAFDLSLQLAALLQTGAITGFSLPRVRAGEQVS